MLYVLGEYTTEVLRSLLSLPEKLFSCFANNQMEANNHKWHLLLNTQENTSI